MDVGLDVDDLPFAATLRSVADGELSDRLTTNAAFDELSAPDLEPSIVSASADADDLDRDDLDREAIQRRAPVTQDICHEGHERTIQKTPVVRDGEVVAVLTVVFDRSGVDTSERDGLVAELRASNRRLREYAFTAAHDLRSPLRRIRTFCQILQSRLLDEEIDRPQVIDFAERIGRGAEGLDALLQSLLEEAAQDASAKPADESDDREGPAAGRRAQE